MADQLEPTKGCAANTDREIWRETLGDYYSPKIHVTQSGEIGMEVGGNVVVMPLRDWHALAWNRRAQQPISAETVRQAAHDLLCWTYQHCINVDQSEYSRNVKDLHPGVFNLMNESERVLYTALLKENEAIAQRANQETK